MLLILKAARAIIEVQAGQPGSGLEWFPSLEKCVQTVS